MPSLQGLVDELNHQVSQQAQSQIGNVKLAFYGHIWTYNPAVHSVTVVMPSYRDQNNNPIITPEIPLATQWAGNNYGIQIAPHGGAINGTTAGTGAYLTGEQCVVLVLERDESVFATAFLTYNNMMPPPGAFQTINPGDILIKHESGSFVHMFSDGSVITAAASGAQLYLDPSGNAILSNAAGDFLTLLSATGNSMISTSGTVTLQTGSGGVIVSGGPLTLDNPGGNYIITPANPSASRILTLPDPGADDSFIYSLATQILEHKAISNSTWTGGTISGGAISGSTWNGGTITGAHLSGTTGGTSTVAVSGSGTGSYSTSGSSLSAIDPTYLTYTLVIPVGNGVTVYGSAIITSAGSNPMIYVGINDSINGLISLASQTQAGASFDTTINVPPAYILGDGLSHTIELVWATNSAISAYNTAPISTTNRMPPQMIIELA